MLLVAQLSFRIARAWGLDSRAVARSALLHDLYHGGKDSNYLRHARNHPLTALHNALEVTELLSVRVVLLSTAPVVMYSPLELNPPPLAPVVMYSPFELNPLFLPLLCILPSS